MNILFLNPPFVGRFSRTSRSPAVAKGGTLYYPIWLAYAAGVAEAAGHSVRLVDAPAEGLKVPDIFEKLEGFIPHLVVTDTSTPSIYNDVKVTEAFKRKYPEAYCTLVGTHPSALAEETLHLSESIDAVAMAEYDYTIRDLACALETRKPLEGVLGLVFRKQGRMVRNPVRDKIENLDHLPFVAAVYKK
ncbi:MAG: cobalamin-dependent protein, partial [Desulfobacterales bacterium]|nr:cobalamin-dependent protein [Desulfobacterales bacterium]